jgi:hypothetical protein
VPNVLPFKVRARVVQTLLEGNSIRSTGRLTKTQKNVAMRVGVTVGQGCAKLHDKLVQHVPAGVYEVDETWGYVGRHERRLLKTDPPYFGDQYTMFAMDADSKLIPSYRVGKRTLTTATAFMHDFRARVDGKPQITFDGWAPWIEATRRSFGHRGADVGSTVKEYQKECHPDDTSRGCGRVKSQVKSTVFGSPDLGRTSTSQAERYNLTSRMTDRRLTRLTNGYSKKVENLAASAALHVMWYNFGRVHDTLGTTPAIKAGLTDHVWSVEELTKAALVEMGADNPEPTGTRPRRYVRKTHAQDVDDAIIVRRPRGRPRKHPVPEGAVAAPASVAAAKVVAPPVVAPVAASTTRAPRRPAPPRPRKGEREVGAPIVPDAPEDNEEDSEDEFRAAPVLSPERRGERGFVPLTVVAHVGLAAVGVLAVRHMDEAIQIQAFGREVPTSGVALGAAVAGALLAYGLEHPRIARGGAALAVGLGTGMLGREATRGLLAAPAPGALSGEAREPLWKRALRWIVGERV